MTMSRSPAAQRRRRKSMIIAAASLGGIAVIVALLTRALTSNPPGGDEVTPSMVIAQLDGWAAAGEWKKVDTLVDYETKGRTMVPDLWDASDEAGRLAMVGLLKQLFYASWQRYHDKDAFKAGIEVRETMTGGNTATVEQVAEEPDGTELAMIYHLVRGQGGWTVVDRVYRRGGVVNSTELFVKSLRSNIARELGHEPTLKEFAANAPSWVGRLRSRFIAVPGPR